MIENTSQITRSDLEFIVRMSKFHPKQRKRIITLTAIAVLGFGWAALLTVLSSMIGKWEWWVLVCIGLGTGLGIYTVLLLLIPEKLLSRKALKHPAYRSPRHIIFTEDGVEITSDRGGLETKLRVKFDKMEGYFLADGVVYVRLITEEKVLYYVCVRDDGYTQGDRHALTALLEKHGVKQLG
ncbi:MAG: hypothetical protein IKN55_07055 [Oscillospiraceae bacterium]|nr:hypothetical protein [Oscillospiraceae bacterium]